jgi:4-hydroxybenzoate polyprenyltransferase
VSPATHLAGLIRLVHPFPSLLCSAAAGAIATLAGADPGTSVRLFVAMLGIQCSVGALNDLVDAPLDAVEKPRKPIPDGLVTRRTAGIVTIGGAAAAIGLSLVSGPATALAAVACLALGWTYDLRLSRTALSWLPLSVALPLLPIHAWLGATGSIPGGLLGLVPVGALAGGGLAIANALADVERDSSVRRRTLAVQLGARRAWWVQTLALGTAALLTVILAPAITDVRSSSGFRVLPTLQAGGIWLGALALGVGALALASGQARVRERGWELEAIGVAGLGIGWLAGIAAA